MIRRIIRNIIPHFPLYSSRGRWGIFICIVLKIKYLWRKPCVIQKRFLSLQQNYKISSLKFRMWFKYGLKAQKLLAQGIALG